MHEKYLVADGLTCTRHSLEVGGCNSLVNLKNRTLRGVAISSAYNLQTKKNITEERFAPLGAVPKDLRGQRARTQLCVRPVNDCKRVKRS